MVDLDELERLLERATPGEWESIEEVGVENFANSIYAPAGEWDGLLLARADQNGSTDNAALIVALHNSAAAMIAEIRELRGLLREAEVKLVDVQGAYATKQYAVNLLVRIRAALTGEPQ